VQQGLVRGGVARMVGVARKMTQRESTHFFYFRRQLLISTRSTDLSDQFLQFLLRQHSTILTSLKHVAWHGRNSWLTHLSWHANTWSSVERGAGGGNCNSLRSSHLQIFGYWLSIVFLGLVKIARRMCMSGRLCLLLLLQCSV